MITLFDWFHDTEFPLYTNSRFVMDPAVAIVGWRVWE